MFKWMIWIITWTTNWCMRSEKPVERHAYFFVYYSIFWLVVGAFISSLLSAYGPPIWVYSAIVFILAFWAYSVLLFAMVLQLRITSEKIWTTKKPSLLAGGQEKAVKKGGEAEG